jgi:hypothetical protein
MGSKGKLSTQTKMAFSWRDHSSSKSGPKGRIIDVSLSSIVWRQPDVKVLKANISTLERRQSNESKISGRNRCSPVTWWRRQLKCRRSKIRETRRNLEVNSETIRRKKSWINSYFFYCSREQIRLVENGLQVGDFVLLTDGNEWTRTQKYRVAFQSKSFAWHSFDHIRQEVVDPHLNCLCVKQQVGGLNKCTTISE